MSIISNAPYYDKYDSKKKYTQLLAVPGRVAQAREITEIQSTMKDIIKSLGDSILNDGNVIEGCQVIPDSVRKKVTVTRGRIYMKGMVLELPESTIDIDATGIELIGVKLKETVIDYSADPDLKDPALGYENYNQPGMDRLKSELELVKLSESDASESTAIIATLIDGELSVEQQAPNYSALNETLARRTYDESGSYIVDGLNVRVESHPTNHDLFNVVIESGKAYVQGYELTIPSARRISMPRALTSTPVTARYTYSSGSNYLLTVGPYVKAINKVNATLSATESVTINNSQGAALAHNTAYKIISVEKSGEKLAETSYRLEQGPTSYIRWTDTSYPGDNIVVTYYYSYEFNGTTDYKLTLDENNNYYLEWINPSLEPVSGESITISYDKYLARKDTAYIDQYGNISVLQGNPADYGFEIAPDAPAYTLSLAAVASPPGGLITSDISRNIRVANVGLTRFTMNDIHKMLKRIRTMEYDQTVLSLNTEAKDYGVDDKKGIFTDPFIDLTKVGLDFNLLNNTPIREDLPIFDTTLDLDGNLVYLPLINSFFDMQYDPSKSNVNTYGRVASLGKSGERVVLSQMKATKSFLLAPYLSYPQSPEIIVSPSLDTWFDDSYVEVPVSINRERVVSTSTRNFYTSSSSTTTRGGSFAAYSVSSSSSSSSVTNTSVGSTVETLVEENVIREEASLYIRPREIEVSGTNYPSGLNNIKGYIEGIEVELTPVGDTNAGTEPGSVRANAKGSFKAKFTIPEKILTGTRVIELKSDIVVDGYKSSASTFYQAIGTARTIQRTLTTVNTVLISRVVNVTTNTHTEYIVDPLAQTFILDDMTLLSGIDIYFENVPETNAPVTCELREVLNGNITEKIYGFKTLTADEIRGNVSDDGSKPTRFQFNDPVLIESNKEYAFVLKSSSQDYRAFVAEIGEIDLQSGEMVLANPYITGVMMSSSNNTSWTVHQKADVKFRLISDTYSPSADLFFEDISNPSGFCRAFITAESLVFEGTAIDWYYSKDGGTSYQRITPYNMEVIDSLETTISIKARLTKSNRTELSPLVALDSVSASLSCYDNSKDSYYISKLVSGLDEYNNVEIILDTYEPSGTSMEVYVSPSNNNAEPYIMKQAEFQGSSEMNYGWFQKTYRITLDAPATQCRVFIKLKSNSKYHTPSFRRLRAIMS